MLNYMAIALPIITFDSENRTMIDPENFFAAPATVEGLRNAITESLKKNTEQLHALGKKNAIYLDSHFSWKATAEVLDSVYRAMLKP
jgi:glycosyltransferase involved in cell wall biosynthesis